MCCYMVKESTRGGVLRMRVTPKSRMAMATQWWVGPQRIALEGNSVASSKGVICLKAG